MKKYILYITLGVLSFVAVSCVKSTYNYNSTKYMPIVFDTLARTDYVTTKKLSAEATLTFKKGQLGESDAKNYKQGDFYKVVPVSSTPTSFLGRFFAKLNAKRAALAARDPGFDFALYALHQKYPDVDYFMDVRVFKKGTTKRFVFSKKGFKEGPETVTIYATGVDLKTDK